MMKRAQVWCVTNGWKGSGGVAGGLCTRIGRPQVLMSVGPVCMGGGCSQLQDLGVEYVLSRLVDCSPEDRPVQIHYSPFLEFLSARGRLMFLGSPLSLTPRYREMVRRS